LLHVEPHVINCPDGRLFLFYCFFLCAFQDPGGVVKAAQLCLQLAKGKSSFLTDGGGVGGVALLQIERPVVEHHHLRANHHTPKP
jgi:hypothetical protein